MLLSYFTDTLFKWLSVFLFLCFTSEHFAKGLQCLECQEVYSPEDCSLSGTCGRDEVCFTRSFINFRDRKAFRMGCENTDVCQLFNRTSLLVGKRDANDDHCRQCCNFDNCNYQLCKGHTGQTVPTSNLPVSTPSTFTLLQSTSPTTDQRTPANTPLETTVRGSSSTNMRDCESYQDIGVTSSGVYLVNPDGAAPFNVYCDMTTDGGGWTVLQNRFNGTLSFERNWAMYKQGFGSLEGEFWLGNDFIHRLTSRPDRQYTVRFDLTAANGKHYFATYTNFTVANERDGYRISFANYQGNAGDNFSDHRGMKFSTASHDNDGGPQNCAALYRGGWWYHNCYEVNINGEYGVEGDVGLVWYTLTGWSGSLKATSMAIRPQSNP